jgi:hypothetical protein
VAGGWWLVAGGWWLVAGEQDDHHPGLFPIASSFLMFSTSN